tara:strand:- start:1851 stop:2165 length:315 start_codon:yes stop_codon:yes gene_type:complete
MSEENTIPAEMTAEAEAEPTEAETPKAQLGVNDLKVMANIIEVVSRRGAIRANEMAAVGNVYNILMNFLIANGAVTQPENQVSQDAPASEDTAEDISDEGKSDD